MSEWKKLALGFGIFCSLTFIGNNSLANERAKEAQAHEIGTSKMIEKTSSLDNYDIVDAFSLMMNERANLWLEEDAVVLFEGSVVYVADKAQSIVFSEAGNYIIMDRK